jgi:hypothetical protein
LLFRGQVFKPGMAWSATKFVMAWFLSLVARSLL